MSERIGFYICHCGINIVSRVRVEEVARYISDFPGVAISRDYLFMCSDPGQELIEKDIRRHQLTRIVVASCSPRMHEKTFREACRRAGLNPYRAFHMVSVREQVSWVTENEDDATQKAKALAGAGVLRVVNQHDLTPATFPVCTNTLVVGGGIAGMQAALDIAGAGYKAYLVERQPTIGGHMLQYDKTFPTLDCAACIGTPKMVSVGQNPNIELLTYSEVEEVNGFIGNFMVKVRKKARYVSDDCVGCGNCAEVCPVNKTSEWDVHTRLRKAAYLPFPQAVPMTFCIEKSDRAPCVQSCPAGVNVQGYITLVREGKYREAVQLIMERLPLPRTLGRICPAPCEKVCRRNKMDDPLAIRQLKRFAADQVHWNDLPIPKLVKKPMEQRIAVIGSGPAGLSCAYFLAMKGYPVAVFEARPVPGGVLRFGIPDYRLPSTVLDQDINYIKKLGVVFFTDVAIGKNHSIQDLFDEGFQAVFVATGVQQDVPLDIPGEKAVGVIPAMTYLRGMEGDKINETGRHVVVIGGTNPAVDAARTALRKGAEKTTLLYDRSSRSRKAMPAGKEAIQAAASEGICIKPHTRPIKILTENSRVIGLRCERAASKKAVDKGGDHPAPVAEGQWDISCDIIIAGMGQKPEKSVFEGTGGIKMTRSGTIVIDQTTCQTSRPGLFAGGALCSGPISSIKAVKTGQDAALSIDRFVQGMDLTKNRPVRPRGSRWEPLPTSAPKEIRVPMPEINPVERKHGFREIEMGFSEEDARREAGRCVSCGTCCECNLCVAACEAGAIDHSMKDEVMDIEVGSIILATGFDLLDPSPMQQYGYGKYANVFTNLEFERLSNATGPTSGQLLKRDPMNPMKFTQPPKSVAILHCIGSRDVNYHEYCSRTCCMYALKYAHLVNDKCGQDTKIYNFYIDMRCFGKGYEEFYRRVQAEGVRMIRGKAARIEQRDDLLIVWAEDTLSGSMVQVPVEMVILCTAMEPRSDTSQVSRTFGVGIGSDGFFQEQHPKLEPVSTASSGVFLAGACQGPKDIPDTVAQAKGAAAEAMALSASGRVSVEPMISTIDKDLCIGCQVCIDLCPFSAISYNQRKGISEVNQAVCKGCGSCTGFCPSGAAKVRHFTDRQIFSEIEGLLTG